MKRFLVVCFLLAVVLPCQAKEFKLYATLLEETPVELADGAQWVMDKGDVFPVLMYKEMQTKIVLQLAGTSFMTETRRVRILDKKEVAAGLLNYRKNVQAYVRSKSDKWKKQVEETAK